jgi:hypothetical protein
MSRASSIPESLIEPIVRRWAQGASAQAIVDWIELTNPKRTERVITSRASVQRLVARIARNDRYARLASVQRLHQQAYEQVAALEEVGEQLWELTQANTMPDLSVPEARIRLSVKMRALNQLSILAERRLRLAGCLGASADKIVAAHEAELAELRRRTEAEDRAAGLRSLPETPFVSTPVPTAAPVAAIAAVSASATPVEPAPPARLGTEISGKTRPAQAVRNPPAPPMASDVWQPRPPSPAPSPLIPPEVRQAA